MRRIKVLFLKTWYENTLCQQMYLCVPRSPVQEGAVLVLQAPRDDPCASSIPPGLQKKYTKRYGHEAYDDDEDEEEEQDSDSDDDDGIDANPDDNFLHRDFNDDHQAWDMIQERNRASQVQGDQQERGVLLTTTAGTAALRDATAEAEVGRNIIFLFGVV
jgi:hypothetical protein